MTRPATPYAGIATRAVALAIDALLAHVIVLSGGAVLALVASLVGDAQLDTLGAILAGVAWIAVVGFYFVLFWSTAGQTPGMRVLALRVLGPDGEHPRIARSIVRVIGLALAIVPLFAGFIPVLFDRRRRGLPDLLARTVVIYDGAELAGVPASPEAHQTASLRPPASRPTMGTDPQPRGGAQA
jgi:uncharacterized RDD family membrane protein YckC